MDNEARNQHFKNLLSIAFADGILDKSELDFLFKRSGKYFITQNELENIISHSENVTPIDITNPKERSEKMLDLIQMMLVDSEVDEKERIMCHTFGISLGYKAEKITEIIDHTLLMIEDGLSEFLILQTIESIE